MAAEMTPDDLRRLTGRPKYGNRRVEVDGFAFASQAEAQRYAELVLLRRAGVICGLECQPCFELEPGYRDSTGKWQRRIQYVGDFKYTEFADGRHVVEDVKGVETQVFRLKAKLFRARYPTIDLRIIRV